MAVRVQHLLQECVAEPLHHAALVLAFQQQGVHRAADVGHRDVALDPHRAGLLVHAHLRGADGHLPERRAAAERRGGAPGRDHAAADQLAARHAEPEQEHLGVRQAPRRRDDGALIQRQVARRDAERLGGDAQELLADVFRGDLDRAARHRGRAARAGGLIVRGHRGVGLDDGHARQQDAEHLGGDLRQDRAGALPHLDGAREHADAAVGVQAHDRLRHARRHRSLQHRGHAAPPVGRARPSPADRLRGARQALLELAVDRRVARRELFAVGQEVLPPELDRIAAEPVGGRVDQRLERPGELRHAEAAKRAAGGRVRVDGARGELDVRDPVGAGRRVRALLDDARADVGVGADVVVGVALDRHERAVTAEPHAHVDAGGAAAHGLERFGHRRGQPHRPARGARERRRQRLELRVGLAAEAAAEVRHDDPDPRERHVEHLRQLDAHRVRVLARGPDREPVGLAPHRHRRMRLHRVVLHRREAIRVVEHEVRRRQRAGAVATRKVELVADIGPGLGPERREVGEDAGLRLPRMD